jgi:hypothetical protein
VIEEKGFENTDASSVDSSSRPATTASSSRQHTKGTDSESLVEEGSWSLNDILSVGNVGRPKPCQVPKMTPVDLPQAEKAIPSDPIIERILREVVEHYGATQCVLTWRVSGYLSFMAVPAGEHFRVLAQTDSQLFNHTTSQKLPIIVRDAEQLAMYNADALPQYLCRPGFYAAVPIVLEELMYIGTLCIVDAFPKPDFKPGDADVLVKKAVELTTAVQNRVDLPRLEACAWQF